MADSTFVSGKSIQAKDSGIREHQEQPGVGHDGASAPQFDWSDPQNMQIYQRIQAQTNLRDKMGNIRQTGDLHCSDAGTGDCVVVDNEHKTAKATQKQEQIAREVEIVLRSGSRDTVVDYWHKGFSDHLEAGAGDTLSQESPLLARRHSYWETLTRPYEKQLVESLSSGAGVIKNADMVQQALKVCHNDVYLAILTMANFTKNMAAIERRRIDPAKIDPSLKDTYEKQKIDSIFNRFEGLADDPSEKYNKEGAIYHFYGAMLAGTMYGRLAKAAVWWDNSQFVEEGGIDRIESAAGYSGAQVGADFR